LSQDSAQNRAKRIERYESHKLGTVDSKTAKCGTPIYKLGVPIKP